jgi:hypothetical protein
LAGAIWARSLAFERRAEEITVAPNQPALADRSETVERDAEVGRNDVEAIQSQSGSVVGDVSNNTCVNYLLTQEVHQHVTIDCRAAKGASFDVGPVLLEDFTERLHAALLAFGRIVVDRRLKPEGRSPARRRYPSDSIVQRNSIVKLDVATSG